MQKFKKAAVESYIAAIALGWIFAQAILHFAYAFAVPAAQSIMRRACCDSAAPASMASSFHLSDAAPDLLKCITLLLVGYILLRWFYFKPLKETAAAPTQDS